MQNLSLQCLFNIFVMYRMEVFGFYPIRICSNLWKPGSELHRTLLNFDRVWMIRRRKYSSSTLLQWNCVKKFTFPRLASMFFWPINLRNWSATHKKLNANDLITSTTQFLRALLRTGRAYTHVRNTSLSTCIA